MYSSKVKVVAATLILGLAALSVQAATNESTLASRHFNPKVSAWAEGTLMSVNADSSKFMIKGAKMPFESAYAKMLQEINEKTVTMGPEEKAKATADIRSKWNDKLSKASSETPAKATDLSFRLPTKENTLHYYDETSRVNTGERRDLVGADAKLTDAQQAAMIALKNLKVGDHVTVGFDDGVVFNDAYILIKTNGPRPLRDMVDGK